MWDTLTLPARGNFSLRKIACPFLAVFVSAFLLTVLYSTAAHAADATWKEDGTVEYAGKIYQQETPIPEGMADIPAGSVVFLAKDEQQKTASALIIPANADQTKEIPNVTVINYTLTQDGGLTNAQRPPNDTITLTARPAPKNKTQCDVAGVGWIICTVSRFIAGGMDIIFDLIANYLTVEPISTNTESGLHQAWSIALGLANLVFILAFLMIIYAHISSYGISNYNLKKMIPKLIVAAILVNLSYYICAIAVDLSNILGRSVQEALIQIRQSLPGAAGGALDVFSWKNITEYILSGGTIVAGVFAAKAAILGGSAAASISGMTFLLFPILVAGVLAVLIALVVLAARQALITVLIVIAPLAFVAYILPNTEKWFEKWRDLFMTMLMVFPLFSLLFGGSQLASAIVLQNTDQLSVALFAMFIQVAPLALTPFLVKFSGSLLGRLAGMINDPKRGIVDRARGWATEKAEVQGAKGIAAAQKGGGTFMQRAAYRRQLDKKNREGWKKTGESAVEAGWAWDSRAHRHHAAHAELGLVKEAGESQSKRHYEELRSRNRNLQRYAGRLRANNEVISALQASEDSAFEEAKSRKVGSDNMFVEYASEIQRANRDRRIAQDNTSIAKAEYQAEYAHDVASDPTLQARAGGIGGDIGAIKVKAAAVSEVVEAGASAVKAIKTASDIKPGDVPSMRVAFDRAVLEGDIASMRAHADMMAESANVGVKELRQAIMDNESQIRALPDIDTFRHHINSNSGINAAAEDIAVWSRDASNGFRALGEIGESAGTWKNLTANAIAGMKASTQQLALDARIENPDGTWSWALSPKMARDIRSAPSAWSAIKDEMKPLFEARMSEPDEPQST